MARMGKVPKISHLKLDIAQLSLDIVGIFEPTPFADGTNAIISLARGNWLDAGLSAVSIIPYLGDTAKLGKIPRYLESVEAAAQLAKKSVVYANELFPAFRKLDSALKQFPPTNATVMRIQLFVNQFFAARCQSKLANITIEGLIKNRNISELTQQQIRNALAKNGIREAHNAHIIKRLIERGPYTGISTLDDLSRLLRRAEVIPDPTDLNALQIVLRHNADRIIINKDTLHWITYRFASR